MKKTAFPNLLRRAAALILAAALALPTVYASAGETLLQTSTELVRGLTYRNTITVNRSSRLESFSLELEADSNAYPIVLQGSGTVYGAATIYKAVNSAQEQGYHVLAAINTDYFSTATGVPFGLVIEDGIYKAGAEGRAAVVINGNEISLVETPEITLTLTNQRDDSEVVPNHLNKWRTATGGTYLLNHDFSTVSTRTSTAGWYVRMKIVPKDGEEELPCLTVDGEIELEVEELLQTDQAISIAEDEYILTADNGSNRLDVFQSYQVGDRITLTTVCEDWDLVNAQWATGVGDVMIQDGELTDSSQWTHVNESRAPRTALGMKRDGTLVLYAADGRQTGYSLGLTQMELAGELLDQDCLWAVNLDGGGSTAVSVWVPGQSGPALQNSPSDGKVRSCATYLLLVTDMVGDGKPDRLALTQEGLAVFTGSSLELPEAVVLDEGLNVLDEELDDLAVTSRKKLGEVKEGVYTAGVKTGTDTLYLRSRDLDVTGEAQIHVVDALTSLTISKEGSTSALSAMKVKPGETVQLAVTGSYWGRTALWDWSQVKWSVEGNIGTVNENGLFTASDAGGSGTLTASVGGQSQTIQITMVNIHTDVTQDHWSYEAVEYCYEHGIVGGVSATEFGRDDPIRRADFMLMLYSAVGKPAVTNGCDFTDVKESDYYYTALAWGQSVGLASGTGDGAYSPKADITREQAFTILRQAMPLLGKECPTGSIAVLNQFADKDQIASYALGHTATLVAQGVVSGKGDGIDPKGNLTRAEMAALLYKLITYTPIVSVEPEVPVESDSPTAPDRYTLTLDRTEGELGSGHSGQLTAVLEPDLEGAEITWTSNDPSVATVSSLGLVTNLHTGTESASAIITASWNGLTAQCVVTCAGAEQIGVVFNAENGLNVRSGPGRDHAVIGGLSNGSRVVILSVEEGWYQVLYRNREDQAAVGYASAAYIQMSE